jgi:two-component system, sensor histidine kinase and response regulator
MEQSLRNLANDLENRVRQRTLELEQANKAKTQFLANMSHEIRTPMAGVMGMTDLLLDQDIPKPLRDDLMVIRSSAVSVLSLLNDMFDLSRIEQDRFEFHPAEFDLRAMIRETMEQYEHEARSKSLEYTLGLDPALPERIICDRTRLGQVIKNLLTNAIKFTPAGKVSLDARVVDRNQQSVTLEFTVTDTGIGIPREHQEKYLPAVHPDRSLLLEAIWRHGPWPDHLQDPGPNAWEARSRSKASRARARGSHSP